MADTSSDYFTSVTQGGAGFVWSNPADVLVEALFADSFPDTNQLRLLEPKAGAEIPAGQIITAIEMIMLGAKTGATLVEGNLVITNGPTSGNTQSFELTIPPLTPHVIAGDLDFWGVTQQQAQDFANGVALWRAFYTATSTASMETTCSYIRCMFTYEPAATLVSPAVMF